MSAHVFFEFIKGVEENDFKKFNYTGSRMLDSIYHMTLKLLKNQIFGVKLLRFCRLLLSLLMTSLCNVTRSVNH